MTNRETLQNLLNANYDFDFFHRNVLQPVFGDSLKLTSVPEIRNINASEERLVKSVKKYGTVALTDYRELDLYDVELAENIVIERSRVSIGAVIKKYIFGNNAVLVNFHYQNQSAKSWRLSFIAKEQQIEDGEIVRGETNPKRYTYILGPNETCRTAAERFEKLSMETEFTIDKLKDAFSVEKLSKTFSDEYKKHYDIFCNSMVEKPDIRQTIFNGNEKAIRDFAKKLLGRIVFLYFVQKKGWLGANDDRWIDGDHNFLQNLFVSSGKNETFYPNWLRKLFYDTLNNSGRKNDAFILPNKSIVKIPFLNGGLFEDDDPKGILTFPPKLFADLFEFFKQYNFTIYEDSPDDHTLSVDPEMLGHIFENLLEDNKDKGAYYTPKEIVHYMCQECLIEYLATKLSITETATFQQLGKDQTEMFDGGGKKGQLALTQEHKGKSTGITRVDVEQFIKHKQLTDEIKKHSKDINKYLDEVKICDPAIGSGAFPMGLLNEIFNAKLLLAELPSPFGEGQGVRFNPAEVKQNIIQNSIYGVDIENGAVDIARLRFWLSLIVDEDKPRALPNLDYKIVAGDSLVPKFESEVVDIDWNLKDVWDKSTQSLIEKIKNGLQEIVEKQKQFFKSKSNKPKLQTEIRNLKIDLLINQLTFDKLKYQAKNIEQVKLGFTEKTREEIKKETEIILKIAGYEQTIKKLEALKKKTTQPLQFFDWKLDFPEIMNPALFGLNSSVITVANAQIIALNNQIDAINLHLKQHDIDAHLIHLQANIAQGQVTLIDEQLLKIKTEIELIYGTLISVNNNIVQEPDLSFVYKINGINKGIEIINKKIQELNLNLPSQNPNIGFDIVIANPPYVKARDSKKKETRLEIEKRFKTTFKMWDLYVPFLEHGLNILQANGNLSMIIPDTIGRADYTSKIVDLIETNHQLNRIDFFPDSKIFENAAVKNKILFITKNKSDRKPVRTIHSKSFADIKILNDAVGKERYHHESSGFEINKSNNLALAEICFVSYGLRLNSDKGDKKFKFKKDDLVSDVKTKKNNRIYTEGKYLDRFVVKKKIYVEWGTERCPARLVRPTFEELYIPEKLLLARQKRIAAYSNDNIICDNTIIMAILAKDLAEVENKNIKKYYSNLTIDRETIEQNSERFNLKYLLAIINSDLIAHFIRFNNKGNIDFYPDDWKKIPIKEISLRSQTVFINLIDKILTLKERNANITKLETEIDLMVYKLYQLTYDEVLVVDKEFEKQMSREEYDKLDYGFEYVQPDKTAIARTNGKRKGKSSDFDLLKDLEF
ncbi:MAG: N-6 DNA methylase [Bacteroidota bacterium]